MTLKADHKKLLNANRKKLTEKQSQALREDAKNGMSNQELSEKYGIGLSSVGLHKIAFLGRGKKLSELEVRVIRKMYKEGVRQAKIAKYFGVSVAHIQTALKRSYFAI